MVVSAEVSRADSDLEFSKEFQYLRAIKSGGLAEALECKLGLYG